MKITKKPRAIRLLMATPMLMALFICAVVLVPASHAQGRRVGQQRESGLTAKRSVSPRNVEIARIVSDINARNIERTIRKLVSFGTRNTLSALDNPTRGIGAARDRLYGDFQKISETSGGRMTVEKQTFEQQPGKYQRIARPTTITNVVAMLHGTQPASANRLYVVSG